MKKLLIILLLLSGYAQAQLPRPYRKWKLGGVVVTPPPATTVTTPPSTTGTYARVNGTIPFNSELLWQDNSPAYPIDPLFTSTAPVSGTYTQALNTYGQMSQIYDNYMIYRPDQLVQIDTVEYGFQQYTGYGGRELQIYSTDRTTGIETLMWQAPTDPARNTNIKQKLSQSYFPSKLRIRVTNNGFPAYVHFKGSYVNVPFVDQPATPKYPFGNQTGINAFTWNLMRDEARSRPFPSAMNILQGLGNVRFYKDANDVTRSPNEYRFNVDWKGYLVDSLLYDMRRRDHIFVQYCNKELTDDINATYTRALGDSLNNERIPVTVRGMDPLDPASYQRYAEIPFQVVARYGKVAVAANRLKTADKKTGLDLIDVYEAGNEHDKWWKESPSLRPSHMNGYILAAFMSMMYDGHKGAYPNCGVKNADPNMPVGIPGLASLHPDILREFREGVIALRGYKSDGVTPDWPTDHYNVHYYNNTAGEQGVSGATGTMIEATKVESVLQQFRNSNAAYLGNMPVLVGETGYDVGQFTYYSAKPPTGSGLTPRKWAGALNLRTALTYWEQGIYRTMFYQMYDQAPGNEYAGFLTQGFARDSLVAGVKTSLPYASACFMAQFNSLMKSHTHAERISTNPRVLRGVAAGQPDAYTIHSPTQSNVSGTYTMAVPAGKTTATLFTVQDGVFVPTSQSLTISGGVVQIPFNETPKAVIFN